MKIKVQRAMLDAFHGLQRLDGLLDFPLELGWLQMSAKSLTELLNLSALFKLLLGHSPVPGRNTISFSSHTFGHGGRSEMFWLVSSLWNCGDFMSRLPHRLRCICGQ